MGAYAVNASATEHDDAWCLTYHWHVCDSSQCWLLVEPRNAQIRKRINFSMHNDWGLSFRPKPTVVRTWRLKRHHDLIIAQFRPLKVGSLKIGFQKYSCREPKLQRNWICHWWTQGTRHTLGFSGCRSNTQAISSLMSYPASFLSANGVKHWVCRDVTCRRKMPQLAILLKVWVSWCLHHQITTLLLAHYENLLTEVCLLGKRNQCLFMGLWIANQPLPKPTHWFPIGTSPDTASTWL